jgi:SanA protein
MMTRFRATLSKLNVQRQKLGKKAQHIFSFIAKKFTAARPFLGSFFRVVRLALLLAFIMILVLTFLAEWLIKRASEGKCYQLVDEIPERTVGVLLGTSKYVSTGDLNHFYSNRIDAAAKLIAAGKIQYLLVSGDNGTAEYDEPTQMKHDLVEAGVPAEKIYRDFAGFRTFDSVVRAKKIFGQDSITVISQEFHNQRAIYIAEANDIDAIGFNAADVSVEDGMQTSLREKFARVLAVLDVTVLETEPKFLGKKIVVGDSPPN